MTSRHTLHVRVDVNRQRSTNGYFVVSVRIIRTEDPDQRCPESWPFSLDPELDVTIQRDPSPDRPFAYGFDRIGIVDGGIAIDLNKVECVLPFARSIRKRWREACRSLDSWTVSTTGVVLRLLATFPTAVTYIGNHRDTRDRVHAEVRAAEERWREGLL